MASPTVLLTCERFCTQYKKITGNDDHGMIRARDLLRRVGYKNFTTDTFTIRSLIRELDNWRSNRNRNHVDCSAFNVVIPALEKLLEPKPNPLAAELYRIEADNAQLRCSLREANENLEERDEEIAEHKATIARLLPADSEAEIDRRVTDLEARICSQCNDLEHRDGIVITGTIVDERVTLEWRKDQE
jgi:hypothetical protein